MENKKKKQHTYVFEGGTGYHLPMMHCKLLLTAGESFTWWQSIVNIKENIY